MILKLRDGLVSVYYMPKSSKDTFTAKIVIVKRQERCRKGANEAFQKKCSSAKQRMSKILFYENGTAHTLPCGIAL